MGVRHLLLLPLLSKPDFPVASAFLNRATLLFEDPELQSLALDSKLCKGNYLYDYHLKIMEKIYTSTPLNAL